MATNMALIQFDKDERALLRKTIASGTTPDQFDLFIQVCRQTGLNPFARQIYAVVRNEKQRDGSFVPKMTVQTSIDGYRLLAQRSGEYAGQDGPYWYDIETREWVDVWIKNEPPAAAKVGVSRRGFDKPIYAVARFESYASRSYNKSTNKYDGDLTNLWAKMPELMIAKVAEALALRRAFPAELSGIYTPEEMQQADHEPMPTVTITPVDENTEETQQEAQQVPVPTLKAIYEHGIEKGVWSGPQAYCATASVVLGITVTKDSKLTNDQKVQLWQMIEQEPEKSVEQAS